MEGRAFISNQLACVLHPLPLKVLFYIVSWNKPQKYYPKNMAKVLHIDVSELDLAIQSLVDHNLLSVTNIDGKFVLEVEKQEIDKYVKIPMERVLEHNGYPLPKEITWNKAESTKSDVDDMSEDEMKRMLLMIQARLNEKEQLKKKVVSVSSSKDDIVDNLPF